ncbi:MAG: hypothetical protein IPO31_00245 [Candidatus Obscuribacter sp.]|nr:hypothetical protein [Candidatus Obscuribacter sp.]
MMHEEHAPRKDLKYVKIAAVAVLVLSFVFCLGGVMITAQQKSEAETRRRADIARMAEINLARIKLEETVAKNEQEAVARERVATMNLHKSLAKMRRWPAIYLRHRQMRAIPSTSWSNDTVYVALELEASPEVIELADAQREDFRLELLQSRVPVADFIIDQAELQLAKARSGTWSRLASGWHQSAMSAAEYQKVNGVSIEYSPRSVNK